MRAAQICLCCWSSTGWMRTLLFRGLCHGKGLWLPSHRCLADEWRGVVHLNEQIYISTDSNSCLAICSGVVWILVTTSMREDLR